MLLSYFLGSHSNEEIILLVHIDPFNNALSQEVCVSNALAHGEQTCTVATTFICDSLYDMSKHVIRCLLLAEIQKTCFIEQENPKRMIALGFSKII